MKNYHSNYWLLTNKLFNNNPTYTIIGEKSISLVDKANEFLAKYRSNQLGSEKTQQTLNKLCNSIVSLGEISLDTCVTYSERELKSYIMDEDTSLADCTTHRGELSYVIEMLRWELMGEQYKNPACKLFNGIQYGPVEI